MRLTKVFMAIFAIAERLPTSVTLYSGVPKIENYKMDFLADKSLSHYKWRHISTKVVSKALILKTTF